MLPRDHAIRRRLEKLNQTNLPRIARNILERTKIDHPHPERAIRFALLAVRSICREIVLFREGWPGRQFPSALELSEELTRLFLTDLGVSTKAR